LRKFLAGLGTALLLVGAACAPGAPAAQPANRPTASNSPRATLPDQEHVRDLLVGIADDIQAIFESFSGGLDNPHDPALDPVTLKQDQARLAAATSKANELRAELEKVKVGVSGGR
jgi:hypothetical protein